MGQTVSMATRAEAPGVAGLDHEHWREAGVALAAAFYDDPVLSWLIPAERRRLGALEHFFGIETRDIVLGHGRSVGCRTAGGMLAGVATTLSAVVLSTLLFGVYSYGVFVVSPFIIGAVVAYVATRRGASSTACSIATSRLRSSAMPLPAMSNAVP